MIALLRTGRRAHARARRCGAAFALAAALGLPAFSAAQTPAARETAPPPAHVIPAPTLPPPSLLARPPANVVPTPTLPPPSLLAPRPAEIAAPPEPAAPAASPLIVPNPIAAPAMALVLPLQSAAYGRAAEAVKAGFLAAAEIANTKPLVIGHDDGGVVEAFQKAKDSGAGVVVGPLVRDDLKAVVAMTGERPWTIALNQLEEGSPPERMYALTLAIDGDARQLARAAHATGAQVVGVVASNAALQRRLANAFVAEWILLGGGPPLQLHFERSQDMLVLLKRELSRTPLDAVLLAVDAADAALLKPYVGQIPAFASSQVNDRQPPEILRDLDGVTFVEIPWLADPDAAGFARLPRPDYRNTSLERLYALGIDAFRVAQAFRNGAPERLEFDGATGHLSLDASRQFSREGRLMRFEAGQIVPASVP